MNALRRSQTFWSVLKNSDVLNHFHTFELFLKLHDGSEAFFGVLGVF